MKRISRENLELGRWLEKIEGNDVSLALTRILKNFCYVRFGHSRHYHRARTLETLPFLNTAASQ